MNVKDNAILHYEYVESVCRKMYIDAFVHGYGHGHEDASNEKTCECADREINYSDEYTGVAAVVKKKQQKDNYNTGNVFY